jgi:hypothetical protein
VSFRSVKSRGIMLHVSFLISYITLDLQYPGALRVCLPWLSFTAVQTSRWESSSRWQLTRQRLIDILVNTINALEEHTCRLNFLKPSV